ncbi:MAG: hypothetical protein MI923_01715 [Phycisphaerales bacterium]|nr:hypothetical protein [Phycisphaerales bacterium]
MQASYAEPAVAGIQDRNTGLRSSIAWLRRPLFVVIIILPLLIFYLVGREHLAGSMLAYLNCCIGISAFIYLASRQTIEAMVPLAILPVGIIAWPLGNIYWAIWNPMAEMTNRPFSYPLLLLQDNVRLQSAVLMFFVIYLAFVLPAARRKGPAIFPYVANYRRWALAIVLFNVILISPVFIAQVAGLGRESVVYKNVASFYYYSAGLLFTAGVLVVNLSKSNKAFLVIYFGIGMFLSAIFSGRGLIARPILAFLVGVFFMSPLSGKRKMMLLAILMFIFPWYTLIGSTTRQVFGKEEGGNLRGRMEVLKNWREYKAGQSPLDAVFGRLHWTGGHSILTDSPSRVPYLEFNAFAYGREILERLLPGRLYYRPHYSGTLPLNRYGHQITEANSVEISMIGHLYMLGGWVPLAVGAACTGLLHVCLMGYLRRTWHRSPLKALTLYSVLFSLFITFLLSDPISHFRSVVWYSAYGWLLYQFLRIITQADTPHQSPDDAGHGLYPSMQH